MSFIEPAAAPSPSATGAPTLGFRQIPVLAGAPEGVPSVEDGFAVIAFDPVNKKLWIYSGAWLSATVG